MYGDFDIISAILGLALIAGAFKLFEILAGLYDWLRHKIWTGESNLWDWLAGNGAQQTARDSGEVSIPQLKGFRSLSEVEPATASPAPVPAEPTISTEEAVAQLARDFAEIAKKIEDDRRWAVEAKMRRIEAEQLAQRN